jgi:excisionase family DNA binding protein
MEYPKEQEHMTEPPILLRIPEVAHLLSISEQKVRNLIAAHRLRSTHVDRCLRVHRADVEAFAEQSRDRVTLRVVG